MTRMANLSMRILMAGGVGAAALLWSGDITTNGPTSLVSTAEASLVSTAEARVDRPATAVSVAGVARRTTRRAVVGTTGAAVVANPAVVAPVVGAPVARGVQSPANRGGPVNRVGRR